MLLQYGQVSERLLIEALIVALSPWPVPLEVHVFAKYKFTCIIDQLDK